MSAVGFASAHDGYMEGTKSADVTIDVTTRSRLSSPGLPVAPLPLAARPARVQPRRQADRDSDECCVAHQDGIQDQTVITPAKTWFSDGGEGVCPPHNATERCTDTESDMSSITQQRDPILEGLEGPRATSWWAGMLIMILTLLVIGSLFRTDARGDAAPTPSPIYVSTGIGS